MLEPRRCWKCAKELTLILCSCQNGLAESYGEAVIDGGHMIIHFTATGLEDCISAVAAAQLFRAGGCCDLLEFGTLRCSTDKFICLFLEMLRGR